jgi:hypothetical protein
MPSYPGAPPNNETLLAISVMGVPFYSARGLSQTLETIDGAKMMRRSINGVLTDLAHTQFRKYKSKISCTDIRAPALDGIWPGMTVVVDCAAYLTYPVGGTPQRPVVPGTTPFTEGSHVMYQPRLTMLVTTYTSQYDEYPCDVAWELELEEV